MAQLTIRKLTLLLFFGNVISAYGTAWRWTPDPGKEEVSFEAIGRPAMIKIHGSTQKGLTGSLQLEEKKVSGTLSLDLKTLDTGIEKRNEHMKEKYLNVQSFPKADLTLKATALPVAFASEPFDSGSFKFEGLLELHGIKKGVQGTLSLRKEDKVLQVEVNFDLKISDFNIPKPGYAGITMAEEVKVRGTAKGPLTEAKHSITVKK